MSVICHTLFFAVVLWQDWLLLFESCDRSKPVVTRFQIDIITETFVHFSAGSENVVKAKTESKKKKDTRFISKKPSALMQRLQGAMRTPTPPPKEPTPPPTPPPARKGE